MLLPIHSLCMRIGDGLCRNLLKAYVGSGCDYLSKVGSKKSAIAAQPQNFLNSFGNQDFLDEQKASYLVKDFE